MDYPWSWHLTSKIDNLWMCAEIDLYASSSLCYYFGMLVGLKHWQMIPQRCSLVPQRVRLFFQKENIDPTSLFICTDRIKYADHIALKQGLASTEKLYGLRVRSKKMTAPINKFATRRLVSDCIFISTFSPYACIGKLTERVIAISCWLVPSIVCVVENARFQSILSLENHDR